MKSKNYVRPYRTTATNRGTSDARSLPSAKLALGLLAGVLTVACLPQASLSAQTGSFMLFGYDYDIPGFSFGDVISATLPAGGGQTGSFQLGRVDRIESVSVELSHQVASDVFFTLTPPNSGDNGFLLLNTGNSRDLGNGGSDLLGLSTYTFTQSASSTIASVTTNPIPGGAYRANIWQSAPVGGWAPGSWTILLRDGAGGSPPGFGAVGRIEVRGALVPEPSAFALIAGLCAFAGVGLRRRVR